MSLDKYVIKEKRKIEQVSDEEDITKKKLKTEDDHGVKDEYVDHVVGKREEFSSICVMSYPKWKKVKAENLNCDFVQLFSEGTAKRLLELCEHELDYNTGQLAKVKIFGKWQNIPRKQVAHGDAGLSYRFSGNTVPARPWTPLLNHVKNLISKLSGHEFNFVLINRYKDGHDHMGEHKDDEADLVKKHPIASLTLGQSRDFVFKHQDARGKNATRRMNTVKVELTNGSLLMMNYPTNSYWYHSLPPRKKLTGVRINMTFRMMHVKKT